MRSILKSLILVFLFISISGICKTFLFDFGPANSEVEEGFIKISEDDLYNSEKGYGWQSKKSMKFFDQNLNSPINLPPLFRDLARGQNTFIVDLPEGRYRIWIATGEIWSGSYLLPPVSWYKENSLKINGKLIYQKKSLTPEEYVRYIYSKFEDDFLPGDILFDKYISPYYKFITQTFFIKDKLILEIDDTTPLNGLIIYPEEESDFERETEKILNKFKNYMDNQFKIEIKEESLDKEIEKKYSKDGLIIFTRGKKEVYPWTKPKEEEIIKEIKGFGTKGEKVVLNFSILPLEKIKNFDVSCEDLISEKGERIPKENISLWMFRYYLISVTDFRTPTRTIKNSYCFKYKPMDLNPMITRAFNVFINIPEEVKEGDYEGNMIIKFNGKTKPIKIKIKVLPFNLEKLDIYIGMYSKYPRTPLFRFISQEEASKFNLRSLCDELTERIFKEMKDIGFNITPIESPWSILSFDKESNVIETPTMDYWRKIISLYKKYFGSDLFIAYGRIATVENFWYSPCEDWRKKGFSQESIDKMEKILNKLYEISKNENWTNELLIYISDELSNYGMEGGKFGKELASIYKKLGDKIGFKLFATMNGIPEHQMLPYLDYAVVNFDFPITDQTIEEIRKAGCKFCVYNIGTNRFSYGYYLKRIKPVMRLQWNFGPEHSVFYNFPCYPSLGHIQYSLVLDSNLEFGKRKDVIDALEGIIDYRYFTTLEKLIEKYRNTNNQKLKETIKKAEDFLNYIVSSINPDMRYYYTEKMPWSDDACEKIRWQIANYIIEVLNETK